MHNRGGQKKRMLSKLMQLFKGKEVSRSVDDELDDQRRELERIQTDINKVKKQLREGQDAVDLLRGKEEGLKEDIEKLLMEVHDPMLRREGDAEITGDIECEWELTPYTLRSADETIRRVTHEIVDSDDDTSDDEASPEDEHELARKQKRRDFVALNEHSGDEDSDEEANATAVAVNVGPMNAEEAHLTKESPPPKRLKSVVRLDELREDDFVSALEYRRWKGYFSRLQHEQMLRAYFSGKVVKDLRERREAVESKLFERHCDLIHLQAFEEHALRQLESYTMRSAPTTDQPPSAIAYVVATDDAPPISVEERHTRLN